MNNMKKNQKFLKNLLASASMFSVVALGAGEASADVVTSGGAEQLSANGTWTDSTAVNRAPVDNDTISLGHALNADRGGAIIEAIRSTAGVAITVNNGFSVGSITGTNNIGIDYNAAETVTLTGTQGDGGNPAANRYTQLGQVDFGGAGGRVLTVNAAAEVELTNAIIANGANGTLNVNSGVVAKDASFATIGTINIGNGKKLTLDVGNNHLDLNNNGATLAFGDADSTLAIKINANGNKTLTFFADIQPAAPNTDKGIISIEATTGGTLAVTGNGGAKDLGTSNTQRLKKLMASGTRNITFDNQVNIFAKDIEVGMTGNTLTFTNAIDSGDGSTLKFIANNANVQFNDDATIEKVDFNANGGASVKIRNAQFLQLGGKTFNALTINNQIKFDGNNSKLRIQSTNGNQLVVSQSSDIDTGGAGKGIIQLKAVGNDGVVANPTYSTLRLKPDAVGNTWILGTTGVNANTLKELNLVGDATSLITIDKGIVLKTPVLNVVDGRSVVKDMSVAAIKEIELKAATSRLEIDASDTVLAGSTEVQLMKTAGGVGGKIYYSDPAAQLVLRSAVNTNNNITFKFMNHVDPDAGNGAGNSGVVELSHTNAGNGRFIVLSDGGKTLGKATPLTELRVTGNKLVEVPAGINKLTVNAQSIKVENGADLLINRTARTAAIEVGVAPVGGAAGGARIRIDTAGASNNYFDDPGETLAFAHADAVFGWTNSEAANRVVTINDHIKGGDPLAAKGVLELSSTGGNSLTVAQNGGKSIGVDNGERLVALWATGGEVIINNNVPVKANTIAVTAGSLKLDGNSASATTLVIGTAAALPAPEVDGTLKLDATVNNAAGLLQGKTITFNTTASKLELTHTSGAGDKTFTFKGNLTSGGDNRGIIEINSAGVGQKLIVAKNANETIGTAHNNRVKELNFTGVEVSEINVGVFAKSINVNTGNVTFGSAVETGDAGTIAIGNGRIATFKGDVNANGVNNNNITFGDNNSSLVIDATGGNVTVNALSTANAGVANGGKVEVKGGNNVVINSSLGLAGKSLTYFNITGAVATNVTVDGASLVAPDIQLDGNAAHSLTLADGLTVNATNIKIGNADGKIVVGNGVSITGIIDGDGGNDRGIVEFNNTGGLVTVESDMGPAQGLKKVSIKEKGGVRAKGTLKTQTIAFESVEPATLAVDGDLTITAGGNGITTNGDFTHTLVLGENFAVGGAVGADGQGLIIKLADDKEIEINDVGFFAKVFTENTGQGKVVFNVADAISYDLGQENEALNKVTFAENGQVKGSVYANNIQIDAGKTAQFNGTLNQPTDLGVLNPSLSGITKTLTTVVKSNELKLGGVNSVAKFKEGTFLNAPVITAINGEGELEFDGDVALAGPIGTNAAALKKITLKSGSAAYLANDIYARRNTDLNTASFNSLVLDGVSAVLAKNIAIKGDIKGTGTSVTLGTNTLDYVGRAKLDGAVSLSTKAVDLAAGNINIHGIGTQLDLSTATSMNVTFRGNSTDRATVAGRTITLLKTDGTATITAPTVAIATDIQDVNRGVKWTYDAATFTFTAEDIGNEALKDALTQQGNTELAKEIEARFADVVKGSDADKYMDQLNRMPVANIEEAVQRLDNIITTTPEAIAQVVSAVMDSTVESIAGTVSARIAQISAPVPTAPVSQVAPIKSSEAVGVAAGDEMTARYGIWANPFYSASVQGARSNTPGYRGKAYGTTVGFDTMANDDLLVGAAYSYADTKIDHKNFKSGDKTRAKTNMFTLYAVQQLPQSWFAQGVASFGSSKITNHEGRLYANSDGTGVIKQTANAKYDSTAYTMEVSGGYNMVANRNTVVTPMVGVRFARFSDSGYTETGTALTNYTVGKKSTNKFDAILGGRVSFTGYTDNGVTWRPELHAFVNQSLNNKAAKVDARLSGDRSSKVNQPKKPTKTFVNVGGSLTTNYSMMEYGLGYDAHLATKYTSHQGTIKIRINF